MPSNCTCCLGMGCLQCRDPQEIRQGLDVLAIERQRTAYLAQFQQVGANTAPLTPEQQAQRLHERLLGVLKEATVQQLIGWADCCEEELQRRTEELKARAVEADQALKRFTEERAVASFRAKPEESK